MKTNIRLLLAIAAIFAATALSAQPRRGNHHSGGGRSEHHAPAYSHSQSHGKGGSSGFNHRPAPSHNPRTDKTPKAKPNGPAPAYGHRPSPGYHHPGPGYHRPAPPMPRPHFRHRPPVGFVFSPVAGVSYALCRFAETAAIAAACNAVVESVQRVNNVNYYYSDGSFYRENTDGSYEVVVPPAGAIIDNLPEGYETLTLNGVLYYKVDNTIYSLTVDTSGKPVFVVVGQMNA